MYRLTERLSNGFDPVKNHMNYVEVAVSLLESLLFLGREVELRRGYSGESLWGIIGDVRESNGLSELIGLVGARKVIPIASSSHEATQIARSIVGTDGPIHSIRST